MIFFESLSDHLLVLFTFVNDYLRLMIFESSFSYRLTHRVTRDETNLTEHWRNVKETANIIKEYFSPCLIV